jgi:tetratricopeptide (TPR) repeat protein
LRQLETLDKDVLSEHTYGLLKGNLASLSSSLSPDERIAMQKEAILLFEKAKDVTNTGSVQISLATTLIAIGRYAEAKKYLRQANQNQPSITAYSTAIGSNLALAQNKSRKAMKLLNKAIKTYPSQDAQYPILWQQKAVIAAQLKNIAAAKSAEETALKLINQRIQTYFPYLSEYQREQYLDAYDTYREYYFSLSCLNKRDSTTTGKLYDLVLSSKGVLLETVRQTKAGISNTTDTLLNKKQTRYSYSKNLLARYYQSGQKEAWMNIDSLEAETEVLEKEISRTAMATQRPKTTWQQIRTALKPNEAAVEIVRFRTKHKALSISLEVGAIPFIMLH